MFFDDDDSFLTIFIRTENPIFIAFDDLPKLDHLVFFFLAGSQTLHQGTFQVNSPSTLVFWAVDKFEVFELLFDVLDQTLLAVTVFACPNFPHFEPFDLLEAERAFNFIRVHVSIYTYYTSIV